MKSSRIGLSDYTAQRLAEIKARSFDEQKLTEEFADDVRHTVTENQNSKVQVHSGISSSSAGGITSLSSGDRKVMEDRHRNDSTLPSSKLLKTSGVENNLSQFERTRTNSNVAEPTDNEFPNHFDMELHKEKQTSKVAKNSQDENCIGFATLPDQVHRKAIKRGFDFTLMVVGESGMGKSTLISSMFFRPDLYKDRIVSGSEDSVQKTVEIQKRCLEIEERGVKLRLTIVDTPGFGDALDANEGWKPIEAYVHQQFDQYLRDETGLNRQTIQDNRVHCCLYFISPYGRGLKPIDVAFMKRLHNKVNIVPIIAKADTLTPVELQRLKTGIMREIQQNNIQIYELPPLDKDEDEEFIRKDKQLKNAIPFAVIGGNTVVDVNGKRVKGRIYPWGIIEVENPAHSDVSLLRQFLVSTHMHDLKDVTRDVHYENFRALHIKNLNGISHTTDFEENNNSIVQIQTDQTEKLLRQKEEEIQKMQQMLQAMQLQAQASKRTVED